VVYARAIAAKEISELPKKQYKEAADQGRAARRTGLQAMRNQRGQPQRSGNKHDQAGPVENGLAPCSKRTGAAVTAMRRCNSLTNAAKLNGKA
jgi:hypothetical protein